MGEDRTSGHVISHMAACEAERAARLSSDPPTDAEAAD